jgi:DNA-directed RNA polymerase specialized sigma54-like protein
VDVLTAKAIVDKHFDAFTKKHYERIMDRLEIDEEALKDAIEVIVKLNPKPGNTGRDSSRPAQVIVPDFVVNAVDGQLELSLNGRNAPELRVSRQYRDMIKEYQRNKKDKDARMRWSSSSKSSIPPNGSSMPSSNARTRCSSPWRRSWNTSANSSSPATTPR